MKNLLIDIQVATKCKTIPTTKEINQWVVAALAHTDALAHDNPELSIRFVDDSESAQLNTQFRDKNGPTNVLSFPFVATDNIPIPLLGDIVISAPTVEREAKEQNKLVTHHWAHMIIHGTLHLLGYDHVRSRDASVMEGLETTIMTKLGLGNPYQQVHTGQQAHTGQLPERGQAHPLQPPSCS
ncbi:MAG: rRNA maturation RNase YbeY [Pseudomonadales bacterium]|nr:rRNA maturation RNase YbeY [Pseudomonadales bacterium]